MGLLEAKIAAFEKTDPAAAAAYRLRHKLLCPVCGGKVKDRENSTTSMRALACGGCGWQVQVDEWHWQCLPEIHLRKVTADVLALKQRIPARPPRRELPQPIVNQSPVPKPGEKEDASRSKSADV